MQPAVTTSTAGTKGHSNTPQWLGATRAALLLAAASLFTLPVPDASAKPHHKHSAAHKHASSKHAAKQTSKQPGKHAARKVRVAAKTPAKAEPSNASEAPSAITEPTPPPQRVLSRQEILSSDADRLERAGRHLVVGYHNFLDVKTLVEKRAIAGIFITDHNVRSRGASVIKADIEKLQAIRTTQGLPPLIVAADQEGGSVSRLSPPLKRQRSLGFILKGLEHDPERQKAVESYAEIQAAELKRLGVTLNFAPVVDLKLNPSNRNDGETRLRLRAIDSDPYLVAKAAGWYCDVFAKAGLMCTLKHFPGLGRVSRDTHVAMGEITASEGQLELNDWVPFRRVMNRPNAVTMLGHVRVGVIDKATPASYSIPVIRKLIRETWGYDGLLITDDFSMGAITHSKSGIGGAAVKSLDAGADLVLVSYIEKHFDSVMSAMLAADASGAVDAAARRTSRDRIARILGAAGNTAAAKAD